MSCIVRVREGAMAESMEQKKVMGKGRSNEKDFEKMWRLMAFSNSGKLGRCLLKSHRF
jgi:hypothetical protein